MIKLTLPYIPTFLAFREVPFLVDMIKELKDTQPELMPQVSSSVLRVSSPIPY
jgi:hypothetical protein